MGDSDILIERLCPDGVKYRALREVATIKPGKDYKHLSAGDVPVYGSGGILTYVNECVFEGPTVLLPRKGSISNVFYVDGPFWNVDTIYYTVIDTAQMNPRFLYHVILNEHIENLNTSNAARPALTKAVLDKILIPVPPITLQEEIVRVLDSFTELEARKLQFAHYRERIIKSSQADVVPLSTLAEIGTGSHDTKDAIDDGCYAFYARGVQPLRLNEYDYDEVAIITAGDGAGVGKVFHYVDGRYALHQRAYRLVPNQEKLLPRYFYHVLNAFFYDYIMANCVQGSVASIRRRMLDNFPVPLPTLDEQNRIVAVLDQFDALVNDIERGLPAEIEARRKQYAYYRERLLTFEEKRA